jgi:hypothetical protein
MRLTYPDFSEMMVYLIIYDVKYEYVRTVRFGVALMVKPLTEEQIFDSLNEHFHEDFKQLRKTHLQQNENIFAIHACSLAHPYYINDEHTTRTLCAWGYIVITQYRRITVTFQPSQVHLVTYLKRNTEGNFFEVLTGSRTDNRDYIFPRVLDKYHLKPREVGEMLHTKISSILRNEYIANYKDEKIEIVELNFGTKWYTSFEAERGQAVYNLMQLIVKNGGSVPLEPADTLNNASDENISNLLKHLAELHKAGILTDSEFQEKKKDLLSRL